MSELKQEFRNAMALLGAAVNVITTDGPAGRAGLTATAVCSVTDSPATLLVCVNTTASAYPMLKQNGRLSVNVLAADQELISRHFASMTDLSGDARFEQDWTVNIVHQPRLKGALAVLEGKIAQYQDVGTHTIMFVEIDYIDVNDTGDSLVYFGRSFHRVPRKIPV